VEVVTNVEILRFVVVPITKASVDIDVVADANTAVRANG
jgi:hypothetical protein